MKIKEKQLSQINENSLFHFIKADSFEDVEKYGIKREDVITIVKDNGQYVLIHYSPSI